MLFNLYTIIPPPHGRPLSVTPCAHTYQQHLIEHSCIVLSAGPAAGFGGLVGLQAIQSLTHTADGNVPSSLPSAGFRPVSDAGGSARPSTDEPNFSGEGGSSRLMLGNSRICFFYADVPAIRTVLSMKVSALLSSLCTVLADNACVSLLLLAAV